MHRMAWAGQVGETDRQTIFGLRGPVMELMETTTSSGIVGRPEVVRAVTRFKPDGNRIDHTRYGGDGRFISRYVFTYDDGDRRAGPRFYAGSPDRLDHVVRFTYDESGRRRRMQEQLTPDGALMFTVGFEYDELDRRIQQVWRKPDGSVIRTYEFHYDDQGNRTAVVSRSGNGRVEWSSRTWYRRIRRPDRATPETRSLSLQRRPDALSLA